MGIQYTEDTVYRDGRLTVAVLKTALEDLGDDTEVIVPIYVLDEQVGVFEVASIVTTPDGKTMGIVASPRFEFDYDEQTEAGTGHVPEPKLDVPFA